MFYAILTAALVVLDQIVKYLVRAVIPLGGNVPFIPYLLDLAAHPHLHDGGAGHVRPHRQGLL